MQKFYLSFLLLIISFRLIAQDCSTLNFTYTTTESRCMATGSITVNPNGGSGNYNFKVIGPIAPPITSSNDITGLPSGYYSIIVKDLNTGCSIQKDSAYVPGSYSDPRFQLSKINASCAGNDGAISLSTINFGRGPFNYTIISPSPANVGQSNATGSFNNLVPGEYYVQLTDSCGGIQVRRITVDNYIWNIDGVNVIKVGCDSADVSIAISDNRGNSNGTAGTFTGFTYGYSLGMGDTTYFASKNFRIYLGSHRSITILVKDNCGNLHTTVWNMPQNLKPALGTVGFSNFTCSTVTATVGGQTNLTNPKYYLQDSAGNLITFNTTGIFPNLSYSSYCVEVINQCYDTTIERCFSIAHGTPSIDANISISNKKCAGFTATVTGQTNLTNPSYCIFDTSNNSLACNTTGVFTNIPYGNYCIKVRDSCVDTTITRCFAVTKPLPSLTTANITGANCSSFNVTAGGINLFTPSYCLYDSTGALVSCDSTGVFNGIPNGRYCIKAISCGDTTSICFASGPPIPSVGPNVQITSPFCSGFNASINGQANLTNPQYCLYNSNDSLLVCNTSGVFDSLAYGSYCIKIHDMCKDSIIIRCFTQVRAVPSVNVGLQETNITCTSFSALATGNNLTNPQFCIYDSLNNQLSCNTTGSFNNLPFGRYCVTVHDGCTDTLMSVCQTINPVRGISLSAVKTCAIGISNVTVQFINTNGPYHIQVYHPNGTKILDTTTAFNPTMIQLPGLPVGIQYKIVGTDNCGNKDSAMVTPVAAQFTKSSVVTNKCPSGIWPNGSGDINATSTSNLYALIPQIIKKDGSPDIINYTAISGNTYTFADLGPGTYIVQYKMQNCNTTFNDTVTVAPYIYPTQGHSAIYQCDNNGFSLGADVKGGVGPYTYQIIGSNPSTPDISTLPQNASVFNINNGTDYSLVRLRSIDFCGNATLADVSVLPLQNISITPSANCFYQDITLSVDTIPNATYYWYRRTSLTDSTLLDSGLTFNLPFFVPEQSGQYICRAVVNNGCITRLSDFTLDGNCHYNVLAIPVRLNGKRDGSVNELYWDNPIENDILFYGIERKTNQGSYTRITTIAAQRGSYHYPDLHPLPGTNIYRLAVIHTNSTEYSNEIIIESLNSEIIVYPNPAKEIVNIALHRQAATNYRVQLISSNGQVVASKDLRNVTNSVINFSKGNSIGSGIYFVKIMDLVSGQVEIRKVWFE